MKKHQIKWMMVIVAGALFLSACASSATPVATDAPAPTAEQQMEPTAEPVIETEKFAGYDLLEISGTVYSAGSSTVYPLSEAIAENFKADGFGGEVKIDSIGSGGGFERFCKTGETDIANASRKIKDSEVESCAAINRTPIQFRVGTDAIAVVVSSENTFLTDVTLDELGLIFTTAVNWSDVRSEWPKEPIQRFTPGTDSGTFDFFNEVVIQKPLDLEDLDEAKALSLAATNLQASEDDNVLVQGIEGSPYAIGYFGFAYYVNNQGNLKVISIDGITPNFETAESGEYVLSRPLFIYSDASILKNKPQVAAFVDYYLTMVNDLIEDVGYFPASEDALNEARQALEEALK